MPLYRIRKIVYDTEQSCRKMPQMPLYTLHFFFVHGSSLLDNVRIVQWLKVEEEQRGWWKH